MTKLVTSDFNVHNARQFIESIDEPQSDNYYVMFGKHTEYSGSDSAIETPVNTYKYKLQTIYNDMIFGKKISADDVNLVVNKVLWESNTIYDIYDDETDLSDKNFYVATQDGSIYNVYKCLFNNNDSVSTIMPTTVGPTIFTETDGYMWKYLYSISASQWSKFSTTSYIPVYSNTDIKDITTDRAIDVILTEYTGSYYNNYTDGTFETGNQIVSSNQFKLSGNAVSINNYYTGCIIKFSTSFGDEYKEITSYVISGSDKTITIDSPVEYDVEVGDTYQIYPKVKISGDGNETSSCLAWAVVDSTSSNSISYVEILKSGSGYRLPTASIVFDESVNVTDEAILRPIISPLCGHGYDPAVELIANKICLSIKIYKNESNNIISANDYRNIILLKNPLLNNLNIEYDGISSIFDIGELVYQYRPIQMVGTVSGNTSANGILTGSNTLFTDSLKVDDKILVQNSTVSFFTTVTAIANDTSLTVSPTLIGNISSSNISLAIIESSGKVTSFLSNSVNLTEVSNNFNINSFAIGSNSFSKITITDVNNNGRITNNLNTLQQTILFEGGKTSVIDFEEDEIVYQQGTYSDETLRPIGRLFHYINDTTDKLYITNERNIFSSNAIIIGNTSGAVFVSTNKYNGDLIKDSGEVLYITNIEAVSKDDESTEVIKITLEF